MPSTVAHTAPVSLTVEPLSISLKGGSPPECPRCREALRLHQPDVKLPNRLLATCETCQAWYLTDRRASLQVLLPDVAALKTVGDTSAPDPSAASAGQPRSGR